MFASSMFAFELAERVLHGQWAQWNKLDNYAPFPNFQKVTTFFTVNFQCKLNSIDVLIESSS